MKHFKDLLHSPVMRTIRLPEPLWQAAKTHGEQTKQPMRVILDQACQAMPQIVQSLRELGVHGEYGSSKIVRAPLSKAVLDAMKAGHERTGLPQILMLVLALHRLTATPEDGGRRPGRRGRKAGRKPRSKPRE